MEVGLVAEEFEIDSSGVIFPPNGFETHQTQGIFVNPPPQEAEQIAFVHVPSSVETDNQFHQSTVETDEQSQIVGGEDPSSSCSINYSVNLNVNNVFEVSSTDILEEIFRIPRNKLLEEGSSLLDKKYFSILRILYSVYKEFVDMVGENISLLDELRSFQTADKNIRKETVKKTRTRTRSRARVEVEVSGDEFAIEPIIAVADGSNSDEKVRGTLQNGRQKRKSCKKLPANLLAAIEEQDDKDSDFSVQISNVQVDESSSSSSSSSSSEDSDSESYSKKSSKKRKTAKKRSRSTSSDSSDSEDRSYKKKRRNSKRLVSSSKKSSKKKKTARKRSTSTSSDSSDSDSDSSYKKKRGNSKRSVKRKGKSKTTRRVMRVEDKEKLKLRISGEFKPQKSFTELIEQIVEVPSSESIEIRKHITESELKNSTKQQKMTKAVKVSLIKLEDEEDLGISTRRLRARPSRNQISSDDDEKKE